MPNNNLKQIIEDAVKKEVKKTSLIPVIWNSKLETNLFTNELNERYATIINRRTVRLINYEFTSDEENEIKIIFLLDFPTLWTEKEALEKAKKIESEVKEQDKLIYSDKKEILRLTNLIKSHKEKIIVAYTHFFAEKELLKELITAHLEYTKAKQEKQPAMKLKKQYHKLSEELEEKIGEEQMEQVEEILTDCETLIHYKTELQAQINNNQKLISDHQQVIQQITYNISNLNVHKGHGFIGNQTIEEVLETKITNTQVGNINIENSQFASSVVIGVGQITEELQSQIQLPPKSTKLSKQHQKNKETSLQLNEVDEQIREIKRELKNTESQLQSYYESCEPDLAKTIRDFIEVNKEFMKNKENDKARKSTQILYKELKNRNLSKEIKLIIENCEKVVGLELLLEKKQNEKNTNQGRAQIQQANLPLEYN